jgi:lipopolysaccharide/colanic/teichoic acid biosynthesis glycosyltransferase
MEAHQQLIGEETLLGRERTAPRAAAIARRALDLVGAILAVLLLAPVLLAVILAVRLDSRGSPFFRQTRLGRDKKPFTVLKFRTMYTDCDEKRHRDYVRTLIGDDESPHDPGEAPRDHGGLYKLNRDDRVTRVGRFLRRWSLDELPQLWNVLRGQMSLTGPRPVLQYEVEVYPAWYDERFAVKPGMTGLWQVSGRNERTYEEMVRLDIEYVRRQSLPLDLTILLRTVWTVLSRRGAA